MARLTTDYYRTTTNLEFNTNNLSISNISSNWSDYYYYYDAGGDDRFSTMPATVALTIVRYVLPVIVLFGTAGNLLSAVVLVRRHFDGGSVDLYRAALAVVDTTVLYVSAFKTWIRIVTGVEWLHASDAACRTLTFILLTALHLSAWMIALLAVDRFMTVWFPFRAAALCSVRAACVIFVCLVVAAVVGNMHAFWTFALNSDWTPPRCVPAADNWFMNVAFNYVKFSTYSLLPFVVVAVLNVLIIYRVAQLRRRLLARRVRRLRAPSDPPTAGDERPLRPPLSASQVRVTSVLVVVALMWLVLTTPFTLISILAVNGVRATSDSVHLLVKTFAFVLMYMNHSVNVVVYCAMERRFRVALCQMVLCYAPGRQACSCCHTRYTAKGRSGSRSGSVVRSTSCHDDLLRM